MQGDLQDTQVIFTGSLSLSNKIRGICADAVCIRDCMCRHNAEQIWTGNCLQNQSTHAAVFTRERLLVCGAGNAFHFQASSQQMNQTANPDRCRACLVSEVQFAAATHQAL